MPDTKNDSGRKRKAAASKKPPAKKRKVIVLPNVAENFSIDEGDYSVIRGLYWDLGVTEDEMGTIVRQSVSVSEEDDSEARRVSKLVFSHEICAPEPLEYSLPSSIGQLQNLRDLSIKLTLVHLSIPKDIGGLTSLEILDLSDTNIQSISPAIGKLSNLKELNLARTKLIRIPKSIFNLVDLERLNLASCLSGWKSLPPEIGKLQNLKELNLQDTQFKRIPDTLFDLTSLEKLNLGKTKIKLLPTLVGNLRNLKDLDLHDNPWLRSIPYTLCHLTKLERLNLGDALNVRSLPHQIGNLTNLEYLNLKGMQSMDQPLPVSIGNLRNLKELDLKRFRLKTLPQAIENLVSLERLNLGHSCIEELPLFIRTLPNLKELDLSYNWSMHKLPAEIIDLGFPSLTTLNLFVSKLFDWNHSTSAPLNISEFEASCQSLWKLIRTSSALISIGELLIPRIRTFAKHEQGFYAKKLCHGLAYKRALPFLQRSPSKWAHLLARVDGDPEFSYQLLKDERDLFVECLASQTT